MRALFKFALAVALFAGCANDFAEYNQVAGLRVLAVRAEPVEVGFEEVTTLDALVTGEPTRYSWSWCPFSFADEAEGECSIPEDDFRELVASTGGDQDPPPYQLGTTESVDFANLIPPALLRGICDQISEAELPEGFAPPACDGRFEVSVRLVVETSDSKIVSFRKLSLLYEEGVIANQNPSITGGQLSVPGAAPFAFSDSGPTIVAREIEYAVALEIPEADAELYRDADDVEQVERLTVSWFYEEGAMDKGRSSFLDGSVPFINLGKNRYLTPSVEESADESTRLYFVIRDDRGGISWFLADLELSL